MSNFKLTDELLKEKKRVGALEREVDHLRKQLQISFRGSIEQNIVKSKLVLLTEGLIDKIPFQERAGAKDQLIKLMNIDHVIYTFTTKDPSQASTSNSVSSST